MTNKLLTVSTLALSIAAGDMLLASSAQAQIDEIIVTARKREESLQTVPVAVTAFNSDAIREKSITDPYDLTLHVPSLTVRSGSSNRDSPDYFLRGQGSTFGSSPGVVVYFNEVPIKNIGIISTNVQLFDLENVQALKGPQGTLFGRSSTGGAILFNPQKPSDEFGGYIDGKVGNLSMWETTGALNVPVLDGKLAFRGAFNIQRRDGFTISQSTGQDLDNRARESYRIAMNFEPTEWLESYTMFQMNHVDESSVGVVVNDFNEGLATFAFPSALVIGGFCASLPVPLQAGCFAEIPTRAARLDELEADLRSERDRIEAGGDVRLTKTGGPRNQVGKDQQIINITQVHPGEIPILGNITLKNIVSFHREREQHITRELSGSQFPHAVVNNNLDLRGAIQTTFANPIYEETGFMDDIVEEFQILGETEHHNWILGIFTEREQVRFGPPPVFTAFNNAFTLPLDSQNFLFATSADGVNIQTGFFGQFTTDLSQWLIDGLSLTGGFRWTKNTQDRDFFFVVPGLDGLTKGAFDRTLNFSETAPSWNVSLDYQVNDDLLIYLAHRRGFKPGGVNGTAAAAAGVIPGILETFNPELVDDIEGGIKMDWTKGSVSGRTNFAAYHSWYSDVQRSTTIPTGGGAVLTQIDNIAAASITGIEIENQIALSECFQVLANYAYTSARYTMWPGTTTNVITGATANLIDSPYPGTPKHQGTLGVRYTLPIDEAWGDVALYGEYYRQSGVWYDDSAIETLPRMKGFQESYGNVNARLDWSNIAGKPIDAGLFVKNALDDEWLVSSGSLMASLGMQIGIYNTPRTYGFNARFRFGADASE